MNLRHNPTRTSALQQSVAALTATAMLIQAMPVQAGADMRPPIRTTKACPPDERGKSKTVVIRTAADGSDEIAKAKRALDSLHRKVEEWGMTTISAPIAVFDPGAFKVPDDFVSIPNMWKGAREDKQGTVDIRTSKTIENTLTASGTFVTPAAPKTGAAAASKASGTDADSSAESAKAAAESEQKAATAANNANSAANEAKVAETAAKASATEAKVAAAKAAAPVSTVKSISAAMREVQDNVIRLKLYSRMSNARGIPGYNRVFFVIVQVSCNPGWRTKENYIADCSASMEYYDMCQGKQLTRAVRREPTVFSVLPLVDAQTIEMSRTQQDMTQLLFDLTAAFPANNIKVSARDVFRFVKTYARDLKTTTPIPVVNSYTSGGTFGFRFSPTFQAQANPASQKARAANVLLPTTFPALVTVVVNEVDLQAASQSFAKERRERPPVAPKIAHDMAIMAHMNSRWYIKDAGCLLQRIFWPMKRDSAWREVGAADAVARTYGAKEDYKYGDTDPDEYGYAVSNRVGKTHFNPVYEELRREIIDLESKALGRSWPIPLAEDQEQLAKDAHAQAVKQSVSERREILEKIYQHDLIFLAESQAAFLYVAPDASDKEKADLKTKAEAARTALDKSDAALRAAEAAWPTDDGTGGRYESPAANRQKFALLDNFDTMAKLAEERRDAAKRNTDAMKVKFDDAMKSLETDTPNAAKVADVRAASKALDEARATLEEAQSFLRKVQDDHERAQKELGPRERAQSGRAGTGQFVIQDPGLFSLDDPLNPALPELPPLPETEIRKPAKALPQPAKREIRAKTPAKPTMTADTRKNSAPALPRP